MFLGLTGRKRSGKNTVAKILQESYPGVFTEVAFADPIKEAAAEWFDLQHPLPDALREVTDPRWGLSPRQIWQRLGTEVGRSVHPDVWLRLGIRRAEAKLEGRIRNVRTSETAAQGTTRKNSFIFDHPQVVIFTDVRFENEAIAIREHGGLIWRVVRGAHAPAASAPPEHASEVGVPDQLVDAVINNLNGTLAELATRVETAWQSARATQNL